jgi:hypothetical protein
MTDHDHLTTLKTAAMGLRSRGPIKTNYRPRRGLLKGIKGLLRAFRGEIIRGPMVCWYGGEL